MTAVVGVDRVADATGRGSSAYTPAPTSESYD